MIIKFVNLLKYLGIFTGILVAVISCEKDFKNLGVDIVDNNVFSTDKYDVSNITAYTKNILKNRTDKLDLHLLGTYKDANFGKLKTSIATQLSIPSPNPDYGSNAVIDSVILNIPLQATLEGTQEADDPANPGSTINVPNFVLDSVWGSGDNTFQLKVFELGTFINSLDPTNPEQANKYYSDATFNTLDELYSSVINPNPNDTILVIKRRRFADANLIPSERVVFKYDTIINAEKKPSIKIPLDNQFFKTRFQDVTDLSYFSSNDNFQHYFRGLYLEALETLSGTSLIGLKINEAKLTVYYSETYIKDEAADEDLNGNGIVGETNIAVGEGKSFEFPFGNIVVNIYDRDYSGTPIEAYLNNPNTVQGSDKVYVSGAAGSDAIIHLFGDDLNANNLPDELETLRANNWLVNDAQLYLYPDASNTSNPLPERLYLYAIDDDGNRLQTYDVQRYGTSILGGTLKRDDNGNPEYYLFHITRYISEILKNDSEIPITDFGVKTFVTNDVPVNTTYTLDTIMRDFNSNHKNVVLKGNLPPTENNRIKLEIFYTEKNN